MEGVLTFQADYILYLGWIQLTETKSAKKVLNKNNYFAFKNNGYVLCEWKRQNNGFSLAFT